MPQLPTEAAPLRACRECRQRLDAPTGTGTFVHGIGAVGYQTCPRCGARWRYLWEGKESRARSHQRRVVVFLAVLTLGALAAALIAAIAVTR